MILPMQKFFAVYYGMQYWVRPAERPILPSAEAYPWAPPISALPDAVKAIDRSQPIQFQRQHSYYPPIAGFPPLLPLPPVEGFPPVIRPPAIDEVPLVRPGIVIRPATGSVANQRLGVTTFSSNPYHRQAPPKKHEKEIKAKVRRTVRSINNAFDLATTSEEWIGIMFDNIPLHLRPRYGATRWRKRDPSLMEKVQSIYDHFGTMDWNKVQRDIITAENYEDRIYGQIGKETAQAQRDLFGGKPALTTNQRLGRLQSKQAKYQQRIGEHAKKMAKRDAEIAEYRSKWQSRKEKRLTAGKTWHSGKKKVPPMWWGY